MENCQHENIEFFDGSFKIKCISCDAIWGGLKYGGGFDYSLNYPIYQEIRTVRKDVSPYRPQKKYSFETGWSLDLIENEPRFWNAIGELRADPRVQHGFVEQVKSFDSEKQKKYMEKYAQCYWVLVLSIGICYEKTHEHLEVIGFVGIVDNDIRICVDPFAHGHGFGKFMLEQLKAKINLNDAVARVKLDNEPSHILFLSCGFEQVSEDENFKYYKLQSKGNKEFKFVSPGVPFKEND
jgi:RimJ/RimL family protein N-acetyltransferase